MFHLTKTKRKFLVGYFQIFVLHNQNLLKNQLFYWKFNLETASYSTLNL